MLKCLIFVSVKELSLKLPGRSLKQILKVEVNLLEIMVINGFTLAARTLSPLSKILSSLPLIFPGRFEAAVILDFDVLFLSHCFESLDEAERLVFFCAYFLFFGKVYMPLSCC